MCLVTSCMTITRAKVDVTVPRKRRGDCSQHEKGSTSSTTRSSRPFSGLPPSTSTCSPPCRHINFDVAKAVLIASPGFVRQQFFDYMYQQVRGHLLIS